MSTRTRNWDAQMVDAVLTAIADAGLQASVVGDDEYSGVLDIRTYAQEVDDVIVAVYKPRTVGTAGSEYVGELRFIMGNGPGETVSDWTMAVERYVDFDSIAERIEKEHAR